jgi:hypothetical protein
VVPKPGPKPRKNPQPVKPTGPGFDRDVELKKVGLIFTKRKPQPPRGVWGPGRPVENSGLEVHMC